MSWSVVWRGLIGILNILSTIKLLNISVIRGVFHVWWTRSIRSATILGSSLAAGPPILPPSNQQCSLMLINHPSPTDHLTFGKMASHPVIRLLQPQEGCEPCSADWKSLEWKYNPLRSRPQSELGCWSNLQACLPSMALLKAMRSQKPNPPEFLLVLSKSQFFQCTTTLFLSLRHQKLAILFSITRQRDIGSLNIDIAY